MSLSKTNIHRRGFLLGLGALSACGFSPALQNTSTGAPVDLDDYRGRVRLPNAKSTDSFALRNVLVSYFGEPTVPEYQIKVNYKARKKKLAITQNSVVTRYRITASGDFSVIRLADNQTILERPFHRIASYSLNRNLYAADQTRIATKERLARAVADDIAVQFLVAVANTP